MFLAISSYAEKWETNNDPSRVLRNHSSNFSGLPLKGKIRDARKGWPSNHWANFTGSIANRWSLANPRPFERDFLSWAELKKSDEYTINGLSPSEKYDLFRGDYSYSLSRRVLRGVSPYENEWHGICHGVAPASMNHPEPKTVSLTNKDGITVTFYSSDVSALMSYYYARISGSRVDMVGKRCRVFEVPEGPLVGRCNGLNAGSFHLILSNRLGVDGESFIADIDRWGEVWNHVAVGYESSFKGTYEVGENSAFNSVKRIRMETIVSYAASIAPKFSPVLGTPEAEYAYYTYEYYLDVDDQGNIIGGEWIGETRPDFLWVQATSNFAGYWSTLNEIYQPID